MFLFEESFSTLSNSILCVRRALRRKCDEKEGYDFLGGFENAKWKANFLLDC